VNFDPREELRRLLAQAAVTLAERQAKAALPATEDYAVVRADLVNRLFDAFISYVSATGAGTRFKNDARKAIVEDVPGAFYAGYADAGGEETEDDDEAWVTGQINAQLGFMDNAFSALKELRAGEFTEADVEAKAELWGQTLDAIFGEGKLRGAKNKMLEWRYGDTDHCDTCQDLQGQRHKASWYLARNYIPGKPGAAMDCGGYRCQCALYDKDGNEYTL
jgi:hypothetical protein